MTRVESEKRDPNPNVKIIRVAVSCATAAIPERCRLSTLAPGQVALVVLRQKLHKSDIERNEPVYKNAFEEQLAKWSDRRGKANLQGCVLWTQTRNPRPNLLRSTVPLRDASNCSKPSKRSGPW